MSLHAGAKTWNLNPRGHVDWVESGAEPFWQFWQRRPNEKRCLRTRCKTVASQKSANGCNTFDADLEEELCYAASQGCFEGEASK
jgi:hypothetical protein